ncbi:MAG TPA: VOC family protein [Allosphingosinicella sp.]|jgi:lactoylglutathione lyase|nr:VOC family protein [Allosphingosinicella sp.]
MRLTYAIKYVADMDKAVAFHRDTLGLPLKFASPFWTEFETGGTTLALHAADAAHPAGKVQLGFGTDDLAAFYAAREANGVTFTHAPTPMHGSDIARFLDSEGAETSVSG